MLAAAHVLPLGFYFFANSGTPTVPGVPRNIMVKRIVAQFTVEGATAMPTIPRLAVTKAEFEGVLAHSGGTAVEPNYHKEADLTPQGTMRTLSTGLTNITANAAGPIFTLLPPVLTQATAVGLILPTTGLLEWRPAEGCELILEPHYALIVHQPDAGTASDGRRFSLRIETMEFRQ